MFNFPRVGELKKSPFEGGSSKAAGDVLFAALHRRAIPLTARIERRYRDLLHQRG